MGCTEDSAALGEWFIGRSCDGSVFIDGLFEVLIGKRAIEVPLLKGFCHVGIAGGDSSPYSCAGICVILGDGFEILRRGIGEIEVRPSSRCAGFFLTGIDSVAEQAQYGNSNDTE